MRYQVQYNNSIGNGHSFSKPFDTFKQAEEWASRHIGGSYWTVVPCYRDEANAKETFKAVRSLFKSLEGS